jgi:hypothetical protein
MGKEAVAGGCGEQKGGDVDAEVTGARGSG